MAGPLTWRNVDAPNFAPAFDGLRTASQLLGNATRAGQDVVGQYEQAQTDAADRAILNRALGLDANQFRTGLQDGSILGPDGRNASLTTLRTMPQREADLLGNDVTRQRLGQATAEFGRTQEGWGLSDNAGDAQSRARMRARVGDMSGANEILNTDPAFRAMRPEQQRAVMTDLDSLYSTNQSRVQTDYGQNNQVRRDVLARDIETEVAYLRQNAVDGTQAEQLAVARGLRPELMNALAARGLFGNGGAAGGTPSGGAASGSAMPAGGGAGTPAASLLGSAAASTPNAPAASGSYDDFVVRLESGGNPNARATTSSASGLYQFTNDTWLGTVRKARPSWAEGLTEQEILQQRFDPVYSKEMEGVLRGENSTRLQNGNQPVNNTNLYAMHHFGGTGGMNFARASGGTPVSEILTPAQIAANPYLKGMTKDEVVANWNSRAGGQGGANGQPRAATPTPKEVLTAAVRDRNTVADVARADEQANSGVLNRRLSQMGGQERPMPELTAELVAGPYKGYTQGEIATEIRAIAAEAGVTNAQAALIMSENFVPRDMAMRAADYIPFVNVAENTFDRARNVETARAYREGALPSQTENAQRSVVVQQVTQAQQKVAQLDQQILAARNRVATTRSATGEARIAELLVQRSAAQNALEEVRKMQENMQSLTTTDLAVRDAQGAVGRSRGGPATVEGSVTQAANRRQMSMDEQFRIILGR